MCIRDRSAFDGSASVREIAAALAAPGEDAVEELVAFARHLATLEAVTLAPQTAG